MSGSADIVVVGGGIGGLTAALALRDRGFEVQVYEQAVALAEVGAGLQLSANAVRVLFELGVGEAVRALAVEPAGKEIRLWNTAERWTLFDLGERSQALYGYPYWMLHRADLLEALRHRLQQVAPGSLHLGARCTGFGTAGGSVVVEFADRRAVTARALIGADGVHSPVREALHGADRPQFSGFMAWRGVVPTARLPKHLRLPVGANWVGPGAHVIHYPLRRGELTNFVGIVERDDWRIERWTERGTRDECLRDFAAWHDDVQAIIGELEQPFKWALMGREPLGHWGAGPVTLLGDAAHPTLPFLAQGAAMALEDAFILARCIQAVPRDIAQALRRYEAARIERTTRIVRGSAENAARFHNRALTTPEDARRHVGEEWAPDRVRARYDWLFEYDVTAVPI